MSDANNSEPPRSPTPSATVARLPRPHTDTVVWGHPRTGTLPKRTVSPRSTWLASEPEHPLALHDSWWIISILALLAATVMAAVLWISAHLAVDAALHTAGLFVHLASLVLGFGGVLVADYLVLVWLSGRCTLAEAIGSAGRLHLPIWAGLTGLVASGCLLEPNLASSLTRIKMAFVLILTINGLQSLILSKRIAQRVSGPIAPRLMAWGAGTALVSQVCWWGAVWIGFLNSQH